MTPLTKTLGALALATLLSACAPPISQTPQTPAATMKLDQALPAYHWDLAAAYDARGRQQTDWLLPGRPPLRLEFDEERLNARQLCNALGARYRLTGERIDAALSAMTRRLCPEPGLMALEGRVAAQLPQALRLELRGGDDAPRLLLHFADGSRWELTGIPMPATRYGSPGERVFLEVAPQTVPCHHPLMPGAQCLRVRDLRYDGRGLRQGAGEWRVLQGGVEGFRHEPGLRQVLRVQRFPIARPGQPLPADAPSHAYVLDMVIEAEAVR